MENLANVFTRLRRLLSQSQPPFESKRDEPGYYDLWSFKDLVIDGRKRKEIFFAGIIIQKTYVGFYFMPVYAEQEIKALFQPELLTLLKGKSCFHIKTLNEPLEGQIRDALATGFKLYRERNWI